jgi:signal transduction histidine kinase
VSSISWPRSIRARYTMVVAALSLVFLVTVGACLDVVTRYKIQDEAYQETERIATQWSAAVRDGDVPRVIPAPARVDLIQVVDSHGHVRSASKSASRSLPLTDVRPPPDDRFQAVSTCQRGSRCEMILALRVSPDADSLYVYAGLRQPAIVAHHVLELGIAASAVLVLGLVTWLAWIIVGRTLRPVRCIRWQLSEITASDLSRRVFLPPGGDEIALLAQTANDTLCRLETAVRQQRRFASDASHELRTPIAGLRAGLEEALLHPADVDPRETIRSALSTTDRLEAIVNDLLVLARIRAAAPAPPEHIDLGALVSEIAAHRPARPPVKVDASGGVRVRGSRIQLVRLVENLLNNAQRHAESQVDVAVEAADGQARLSVTDDGSGVPPEERERIFARFTRLSDARRRDPGGSGLGLAISREIAEAHGGTLRVEDSPRGARFVLGLPLR